MKRNKSHSGFLSSRMTKLPFWLPVLLVAASVVGGSCQSNEKPVLLWNEPEAVLVWPAPPDEARIRYVGTIESAGNLGGKPSFGKRLKTLFTGKENSNLVKPVALAKSKAGLLVVADAALATIHYFDLENQQYVRPRKKNGDILVSPVGVAITDDHTVYVADSYLCEVVVFDGLGNFVDRFGSDQIERPSGICLSPDQEQIYVVDTVGSAVVTFDRNGNELARFGSLGTGPGQFNYPTFVSVGPDGNICVSDSLNFRVQLFQSDGTFVREFGQAGDGAGSFSRPKGISFDSASRVFVVDTAFENVQIFDDQGGLLLGFGGPGEGPGEFTLPVGLFVDSENLIWVADSFNQRVQVFELMKGDDE